MRSGCWWWCCSTRIHFTLYLLGCGIGICNCFECQSILFSKSWIWAQIHEFVCIKMPKRPLLSSIASRLRPDSASARDLGSIRKQIGWRAQTSAGTWPPSSTCPLLKLTAPSAREIALKFENQFSTRFRDRVNVTSLPSLGIKTIQMICTAHDSAALNFFLRAIFLRWANLRVAILSVASGWYCSTVSRVKALQGAPCELRFWFAYLVHEQVQKA